MMTDEEMGAIRKIVVWMRDDALPEETLLTEENVHRIFVAAHSAEMMLAHIDEQAKQINELDRRIQNKDARIQELESDFKRLLSHARNALVEQSKQIEGWIDDRDRWIKRYEDIKTDLEQYESELVIKAKTTFIKDLEVARLKAQNSNLIRRQQNERNEKGIADLMKQVALLKDALIEERAMVIFCHDPRPDRADLVNKQEARDQLKREFPGMDWE